MDFNVQSCYAYGFFVAGQNLGNKKCDEYCHVESPCDDPGCQSLFHQISYVVVSASVFCTSGEPVYPMVPAEWDVQLREFAKEFGIVSFEPGWQMI